MRVKVGILRDMEKHTHKCKHTHPHTHTHTHTQTHTYIYKYNNIVASYTHSFQSGSLGQTARHCRELELEKEAERRGKADFHAAGQHQTHDIQSNHRNPFLWRKAPKDITNPFMDIYLFMNKAM